MTDSILTERGCYTDHGVSGYSVAAKFSKNALMGDDFVREVAEVMMLSIAEKCEELGARAIGHIKSFIKTDAGTVKADTIGISHGAYSFGYFEHSVKNFYMAVNSVVQGIPEGAVKAATLEGMHQVADRYGLAVVKEKDHAYFDAFDAGVIKNVIEEPLDENDSKQEL
jgi:hypothetical protein